MYIVAFAIAYGLACYRIRKEDGFDMDVDRLQGLFTAVILGLILGGRMGYVLFYNLPYYLSHPLEIVLPFEFSNGIRFTGITGMAYHGGLSDGIARGAIFVCKSRLNFFHSTDPIFTCINL